MKGQLMTISVLIFVLLMAVTLVSFVVINIGYDQISESSVSASAVYTYAVTVRNDAFAYAYYSGLNAMAQLYKYEATPQERGTNLASNLSLFLDYLMVNGTVPYTAQTGISNTPLSIYNHIIDNQYNYGLLSANVIESNIIFTQANPYSISMYYVETMMVNTSEGNFRYSFPVNASLSLSSTPDLFYAQQGTYLPVRIISPKGLVTNVGNEYASSGSTGSFVYGTVYSIPSPSSCASLGLPATLNTPPYNSQVIIVTPDASAITAPGCGIANEYGGLITGKINSAPSVPYLVYPQGSNSILYYLETGQQVLLYGPSLSVLNITGLETAVQSQDFITSPFAPDYLQRSQGNLYSQSPYGVASLAGPSVQFPYFNDFAQVTSNYIETGVSNYTIAAWVKTTAQQGTILYGNGGVGLSIGPSCAQGAGLYCTGSSAGVPAVGVYDPASGAWVGLNSNYSINDGRWHFIAATFNSVSASVIAPSSFRLYVDGMSVSGASADTGTITSPLTGSGDISVGADSYLYFNGMIANLQVYNETLTPSEIQSLYLNGLQALPLSNPPNSINPEPVIWLPLTSDSGQTNFAGSQIGTNENGLSWITMPAYTGDSLFPSITSHTYPVPGIGTCSNPAQCVNQSNPNMYLGTEPFQTGSGTITAAYFNGQTSYIEPLAGFNSMMSASQPFSASVWVYPTSPDGVILDELGQQAPATGWQYSMLELVNNQLYARIPGGTCTDVGTVPSGSWSSIVLTYSGSAYSAYINGALASSAAAARTVPNTGAAGSFYPLGAPDSTNNCGSGAAFSGLMSDYQFYSTALSGQEASSIFSAGLIGTPVDHVNLLGWWPLNGNAKDYSGNGNIGAANSIAYEYVGFNASPSSSQYQSGQGLMTSSSSSVWQALGFAAPSLPEVLWNVTAWQLPAGSGSISYATVSTYPANAVTSYSSTSTGGWYSGIEGGLQQWSFGSGGYMGSYSDLPVSPFPPSLNLLNSYVNCQSGTENTTFYSAQTAMQLGGTYTFQMVADDEMGVFYREAGTSSWNSVFGAGPWNGQVTGPYNPGPVTISLPQASYQFVVDWSNLCAGGLSSFSMS